MDGLYIDNCSYARPNLGYIIVVYISDYRSPSISPEIPMFNGPPHSTVQEILGTSPFHDEIIYKWSNVFDPIVIGSLWRFPVLRLALVTIHLYLGIFPETNHPAIKGVSPVAMDTLIINY